MSQDELFYDTLYDAIHSAILAGGGFKEVSGLLWPSMKQSSAYARLKSCVDEHKDEKLDPEELLAVARHAKEKGNHAIMNYFAQELGYEVRETQPKDELTALIQDQADDFKRVEARQKRIERVLESLANQNVVNLARR